MKHLLSFLAIALLIIAEADYNRTSAQGNAGFSPGEVIGSGEYPVCAGDLNGDRKVDILASYFAFGFSGNEQYTAWYEQINPAHFEKHVLGASSSDAHIADLNGDGAAEAIVSLSQAAGSLVVFSSDPTSRSALIAHVVSNDHNGLIYIADVNNDHRLDIVGLNENGFTAYLRLPESGFSFEAHVIYQPPPNIHISNVSGFAVADFNGDMRPDFILSGNVISGGTELNATYELLSGNEEGDYTLIKASDAVGPIRLVDWNHDGTPEFLAGDYLDLNQDGYLDLLSQQNTSNTGVLGVQYGNSDTTLSLGNFNPIDQIISSRSTDMFLDSNGSAVADVDGDGDSDLITGLRFGGVHDVHAEDLKIYFNDFIHQNIEVYEPHGGEHFQARQPLNIDWSSFVKTSGTAVAIDLLQEGKLVSHLLNAYSPWGMDSTRITLPDVPGNSFTIRITSLWDEQFQVSTPSFTIEGVNSVNLWTMYQ